MWMAVFNSFKKVGSTLLLVALTACAGQPARPVDASGNIDAFELMYDETEPGQGNESFITRIVILDDRVRISDSRHPDNFMLLNRKTQTLYSVTQSDKTIFVIKGQPVSIAPPLPISYEVVSQPSSAIPKISNLKATHLKYIVNGEHCYDTISLGRDFFPEAAKALGEVRQVLAGEQAKSLAGTPKDLLDACELALHIFRPTDHLQQGFPFREWDRKGYSRFIRYYRENVKVKPEEFELPEGFLHYSVGLK